MQIYSQKYEYTLLQGNMLDMGDFVGGGTIDSIVTDPPYELNFMGKGWDNSGIAFQPDTWKRCLEVLKPGGYLLAFGGSRTYHRIACAIEDAGFEIRDCIMWLYGSGFPKSLNLAKAIEGKLTVGSANTTEFHKLKGDEVDVKSGYTKMEYDQGNKPANYQDRHNSIVNVEYTTELAKQREGWGTQLKPSYEPIIVARKPLEGSCTDNVIKYGVGGINIDECRVETQDDLYREPCENGSIYSQQEKKYTTGTMNDSYKLGRFPANTILTYDESDFEEVCGGFPNNCGNGHRPKTKVSGYGEFGGGKSEYIGPGEHDGKGSAARYFKNCDFSLRDIDQWKQLYVSNAEKSLEILRETIESIVPISADMLLGMLKDLNVKYAENQLDLGEIHIVPDIVEMLTYDFRKEGLQAILDFIGNYKNCIQLQSLVQFVEKCDSIDTTQTTQNLLKLFGYVRAAITKYTQTIKNEEQKRYIYTPKASKRDRDEGCTELEDGLLRRMRPDKDDSNPTGLNKEGRFAPVVRKNTHPTVKPCDLMQYLVRLVTPNGGTVLDPFNGSGSTGKAVMYENKDRNKNYKYIGIELTEEYLPIAKARIEYVINKGIEKEKSDPKQEEQTKQRKESALF